MRKEIVKTVVQIAAGVFAGTAAANAMENLIVKPIKNVIQAKKESQQ